MRRVVPLMLLLLGGCAALQKQPPATAAPPKTVVAACIDASQIPPEPPMVGARFNGDAKHDLQVLAPNAKALREWGEQMRAMLTGCAANPAAAAPAAKP